MVKNPRRKKFCTRCKRRGHSVLHCRATTKADGTLIKTKIGVLNSSQKKTQKQKQVLYKLKKQKEKL